MNRAIKFRAWLRDEYMSYSHTNKGLAYLEFDDDGSTIIGEDDGDQRYENVPVMQFTGLYDKNKKPIYEGDVVKVGSQKWFDKNYFSIEEVTFSHSGVRFGDKVPYSEVYAGEVSGQEVNYYDTFEVIGNIYENSDLVKGNK